MTKYEESRQDLVDKGFTVTRLRPSKEAQAVSRRTNPRDNTFDLAWTPGTLPAWVRRRGASTGSEDERLFKPDYVNDGHPGSDSYSEPKPIGLENRPRSEVPYIDALYDFFKDRIERWPGTAAQKEYLHSLMHDPRAQREVAKEDSISQAAVSLGRSRAVDAFVAWAGGKAALAEAIRQYLVDREAQDAQDRLKYLPRWVHG